MVATLGDALASTCSIEFARSWLGIQGGLIVGYESFEAAAEAVLGGEAQYLLVPGMYPQVGKLALRRALKLHDHFVDRLPTIVLVSAGHESPLAGTPVARLYYHPALREIADDLSSRWDIGERIEVSSNPAACQRVLVDSNSLALTNTIAAPAYGVRVLEDVREGWNMPCVVFKLHPHPESVPDLEAWMRLDLQSKPARE